MSDIIDGWYYSLVDTPSPLTQEEKEKNVDMFRAYFEGYMTLESMAGILGNMQRESYLNPGQGELNKDFDTRYGYGLIQWTPGSVITNWSDERGLTWYSGQTQCYRIKCEGERIEGVGGTWLPTSDYPYSWEECCALSDYEEATKAYLFERERAGVSALDLRLQYAREWYEYLTESPGPTPPPDPPVPPVPPHDPIDKKLLIILAKKSIDRRLLA